MAVPFSAQSLRTACDALRAAIMMRASGDVQKIQAPFYAILSLEQAALNAPQNRGWLRARRIELRDALDVFSAPPPAASSMDELRSLYAEIANLLSSNVA
jgi:hypothetical protein